MTGLRERKKVERREHILACGEKLFDARGFDVTTMETIAACADISPATLYNFFPTKLDILTVLYGRKIEERVAEFHASAPDRGADPVDEIHALATAVFNAVAGFDRGLLRRVTLNALNEGPARDFLADDRTRGEIVLLLKRRQGEGSLAPGVPVEDLAAAILACGNGEYFVWLADDEARIGTLLANVRRHIALILSAAAKPA